MLLIAGKIEFFMGGDMIGDFLAVQNNIPTIAVAAHFQKNPQIFMSHPGVGLDKWEDLPKANPAFVSAGAVNTFWAWMRLAYGFKDENIKPYNFNSAPFIVDQDFDPAGLPDLRAARGRKAGRLQAQRLPARRLRLHDLLDPGRNPPRISWRSIPTSSSASSTPPPSAGTTISTATTPKANEAIKKENPEMTDEQIAFSIAKMKEYGIVDSGDTLKLGIGAMTDDRWSEFYNTMVKAGVVKAGLDYKKAYTTQFVNKGVGLDLRPK